MKTKTLDLERLIAEEISAWLETEDETAGPMPGSEVIGLIAWYFAQTNTN